MPRSTTMTAAAFAALVMSAFAAPAAAQVTSAGGEVASSSGQKQLVGNLITIDSIQAATAKLAATKAQNAAVKEFANQLASDHTTNAMNLSNIANKKDVGRESAGSTVTSQFSARFAALQTMPEGPEFDKAFLQAVVANHQAEISTINSGKASATDEDLKKDLDATLTGLQAHVSKANELTASLDKTPAKPPR